MEQAGETTRTRRNVECQSPARGGEAEWRRVARTHALEHGEEAGGAATGELLDDGAHRRFLPERDDELVLHQTADAVETVPADHHVEGVEERGNALQLTLLVAGRLAVPELVEDTDGEPVENSHRRHQRRYQYLNPRPIGTRLLGVARPELVHARMITAGQHTAPEATTLGHQIDPGDAVAVVVVTFAHRREQGIDVGKALGVHRHPTGLDRYQAEGGFEDHSGEAHPADRRPEQFRIRVRPDGHLRPVSEEKGEGLDMVAEGSLDVMVLAVHVAGDRPTDGHEAGPGGDRHEPSPRHEHLQQFVDAHSGRNGDRATLGVDDCLVG